MNEIPAISVRLDMIDGQFELEQDTVLFMSMARGAIAALAKKLAGSAPASCDVGRMIAAIDHLQQAKNILCDSAILGAETQNRKRKKESE